jgi:hypothetical protein
MSSRQQDWKAVHATAAVAASFSYNVSGCQAKGRSLTVRLLTLQNLDTAVQWCGATQDAATAACTSYWGSIDVQTSCDFCRFGADLCHSERRSAGTSWTQEVVSRTELGRAGAWARSLYIGMSVLQLVKRLHAFACGPTAQANSEGLTLLHSRPHTTVRSAEAFDFRPTHSLD